LTRKKFVSAKKDFNIYFAITKYNEKALLNKKNYRYNIDMKKGKVMQAKTLMTAIK